MAGGILREGGVPEKETEEMRRAWRRERNGRAKEAKRGKNVTDGSNEGGREKRTRGRRKRRRERERGNGPNESMNGARESEAPKSIPVFVKGTGTPATWRQDRRRRRRGWRREGNGCRRGGGFRTAKAVGPRTVASTLPPLSVASRFPDTADRHTGRLVNPILVHSPASQRASSLRPFLHTLLLFLSPSGTSPSYNRYTPRLYSCFTCRFCCRRPRFFPNFCRWWSRRIGMYYIRVDIRDSFSNRERPREPKRATTITSKRSAMYPMSLSECHNWHERVSRRALVADWWELGVRASPPWRTTCYAIVAT